MHFVDTNGARVRRRRHRADQASSCAGVHDRPHRPVVSSAQVLGSSLSPFVGDSPLSSRPSVQVLGEFSVTFRRRFATESSAESARQLSMPVADRVVSPIDAELVGRAMRTVESHQLSHWDALIVESASEAACDRLATEDLQHGAVIRGVEIWNPFADVA